MPDTSPLLSYDRWSATCDTLHGHTQVLGKLAAVLAPHACAVCEGDPALPAGTPPLR